MGMAEFAIHEVSGMYCLIYNTTGVYTVVIMYNVVSLRSKYFQVWMYVTTHIMIPNRHASCKYVNIEEAQCNMVYF